MLQFGKLDSLSEEVISSSEGMVGCAVVAKTYGVGLTLAAVDAMMPSIFCTSTQKSDIEQGRTVSHVLCPNRSTSAVVKRQRLHIWSISS